MVVVCSTHRVSWWAVGRVSAPSMGYRKAAALNEGIKPSPQIKPDCRSVLSINRRIIRPQMSRLKPVLGLAENKPVIKLLNYEETQRGCWMIKDLVKCLGWSYVWLPWADWSGHVHGNHRKPGVASIARGHVTPPRRMRPAHTLPSGVINARERTRANQHSTLPTDENNKLISYRVSVAHLLYKNKCEDVTQRKLVPFDHRSRLY